MVPIEIGERDKSTVRPAWQQLRQKFLRFFSKARGGRFLRQGCCRGLSPGRRYSRVYGTGRRQFTEPARAQCARRQPLHTAASAPLIQPALFGQCLPQVTKGDGADFLQALGGDVFEGVPGGVPVNVVEIDE